MDFTDCKYNTLQINNIQKLYSLIDEKPLIPVFYRVILIFLNVFFQK